MKAISRNCILRLSLYKKALNRFRELGFAKITSSFLAESVGVTGAQVRKDFAHFRIEGNKRGGYRLAGIIDALNVIFQKHKTIRAVLVGAGNLGSAFLKYRGFGKEGIQITAAFDIDPGRWTCKAPVPVLPLSMLKSTVRKQRIRIGVLAVPDMAAQQALDAMLEAGIEGVLNFAPTLLRYDEKKAIVSHVNLEQQLENLVYFVELRRKQKTSAK